MPFCDSCGAELKSDGRFCHSCGKEYIKQKTSKVTETQPRKIKTTFWLPIVGIIFIAVVIVIYFSMDSNVTKDTLKEISKDSDKEEIIVDGRAEENAVDEISLKTDIASHFDKLYNSLFDLVALNVGEEDLVLIYQDRLDEFELDLRKKNYVYKIEITGENSVTVSLGYPDSDYFSEVIFHWVDGRWVNEGLDKNFLEITKATVIVEQKSFLFLRKSPGTLNKSQSDIIERMESGKTVIVVNKYQNSLEKDGYIWWEVYNPDSQNQGWAAAEFLLIEGEEIVKIENEFSVINAVDYYPLERANMWVYTLADGGYSEYNIFDKPLIQNGAKVFQKYFRHFMEIDGRSQEISAGIYYYATNEKGDLLYLGFQNTFVGEKIFDKPKLIIKNNISVGDSWEYLSEGELTKRKLTGLKTVITPAGTFDNCIEIEETITAAGQSYFLKHYYAKDVGLVKSIIANSGETFEELVSFNP